MSERSYWPEQVMTLEQPTQASKQPIQTSPQPSQAQQPISIAEQSIQGVEAKPKWVHYTPDLKLLLLRLCIKHQLRYLEEPTEFTFWQFITALFREKAGHQGADLRKKVNVMVGDRKGALEAWKLLSGVALPPTTDLEQAIDYGSRRERRNELRETVKAEGSAEVKREKAVSEVLRDNLTKRLSKKRDFQAVVEAREVVDLTAPGNIHQERRQIRENLRAKTSNNESKEKMRGL
ncbi:hypothetical protein BGX38DRAFT_1275131 [Terfezia claveryi]|nr:hypothetical protein BGX38DRAFT_1275131 [Terfezia claveryi]